MSSSELRQADDEENELAQLHGYSRGHKFSLTFTKLQYKIDLQPSSITEYHTQTYKGYMRMNSN